MEHSEALRALRDSLDKWEEHRIRFRTPQLSRANLQAIEFEGYNFSNTTFWYSTLSQVTFKKCVFNAASFEGAKLVDVYFEDCEARHSSFKESKLTGCIFKGDFTGANFAKSEPRDCSFVCLLDGGRFEEASLKGQSFDQSNLKDVTFDRADLRGATLKNALLDSATFRGADLREANLLNAKVNSDTVLVGANVEKTMIDRLTIESLKDYGGLSKGERVRMNIVDDLALLRSNYSGFLQWLHVLALVIFVAPYAGFLALQWLNAHFNPTDAGVPLYVAFGRYIWSGGESWAESASFAPVPFTIFVLSLIYNAARGCLLWKTKALELREEVTGLPSGFSFASHPSWGRFYVVMKWGLWLNLALVIIHTVCFLRVNVGPLPSTAL